MADRHALYGADDAVVLTPSDSANIDVTRGLLIGAGGAIKVTMASGNSPTLTVPAGVLPLRVTRVWSTGTTATGIAALY